MNASPPIEYKLINCSKKIDNKSEMKDYASQIPWMSYRDGFVSVDGYCSDTGWGCMIRVAQMMIAHTLMKHIRYRMGENPNQDITVEELMRIILPLFLDDFIRHESPFSIHNIIQIGKLLLKKGAGEWYGAHSISQVIRSVNEKYNSQYSTLKILTFNDGIIYKEEITQPIEEHKNNGWLVIVPLRMGLKKIDKCYYTQIKEALSWPFSVGILGGKSTYALYWIGYYNEKLITLDPHTEQDSVNEINDKTFPSFVTRSPKIISFSEWDTTMAFWFYLKNAEDTGEFYANIQSWMADESHENLISLKESKSEVEYFTADKAEFDDEFELI